MSALRRVTAPPNRLAEAVTKSLRPDSLPEINQNFYGPRRSLELWWNTAISLSSLVSSGFPVWSASA